VRCSIVSTTYTIGVIKSILIDATNPGVSDFYLIPNTLDLDTFGTFWQGDVAQVMYDPILPYPTPLSNPVSMNNYDPVGAGAMLEEAVSVQPVGSPAMPTNSRPLDTAGMIAAINAMPLGMGFDAAPVNPEGWPLGLGVSGETGLVTGSAPWNNLPP